MIVWNLKNVLEILLGFVNLGSGFLIKIKTSIFFGMSFFMKVEEEDFGGLDERERLARW